MNSLFHAMGYNYRDCIFDDDFTVTMPSSFWTTVLTDTGTGTIGIQTMNTGSLDLVPSDGTVADNDEAYAYGKKIITLKAGAGFAMFFCLSYVEANVDDANIAFGLVKTAPIANFLGDDAAGVAAIANDDGFFFEKVDGTNYWKGLTQWSAASYTARHTSRTSPVFTGRQVGIIEVRALPNLVAEVTFKIAYIPTGGTPEPLTDVTGLMPMSIRHRFAFTGSTDLMPVMAAKNGGANNETISFDRVTAFSLRA